MNNEIRVELKQFTDELNELSGIIKVDMPAISDEIGKIMDNSLSERLSRKVGEMTMIVDLLRDRVHILYEIGKICDGEKEVNGDKD